MEIYSYRMPWGDTLRIAADLADERAQICIVTEGDDGEDVLSPTPWISADARCREGELLRLAVRHMGPDWYADPSSPASADEQFEAVVSAARAA